MFTYDGENTVQVLHCYKCNTHTNLNTYRIKVRAADCRVCGGEMELAVETIIPKGEEAQFKPDWFGEFKFKEKK